MKHARRVAALLAHLLRGLWYFCLRFVPGKKIRSVFLKPLKFFFVAQEGQMAEIGRTGHLNARQPLLRSECCLLRSVL